MNIFVAKLSSSTTSDGLLEIFQQFGEVKSAKVIMDRETGLSKGYGFVEMANDAEGRLAISELNDSEVDGNVIVVKESQPKPAGGFKPSGFANKGGGGRKFGNDNGGGNRFKKQGGYGDRPKFGGYRNREE